MAYHRSARYRVLRSPIFDSATKASACHACHVYLPYILVLRDMELSAIWFEPQAGSPVDAIPLRSYRPSIPEVLNSVHAIGACQFAREPCASHSDIGILVRIPTQSSRCFRDIPAAPEEGLAVRFASSRPTTARCLLNDPGERPAKPETKAFPFPRVVFRVKLA
jgi:hypothetical protein